MSQQVTDKHDLPSTSPQAKQAHRGESSPPHGALCLLGKAAAGGTHDYIIPKVLSPVREFARDILEAGGGIRAQRWSGDSVWQETTSNPQLQERVGETRFREGEARRTRSGGATDSRRITQFT